MVGGYGDPEICLPQIIILCGFLHYIFLSDVLIKQLAIYLKSMLAINNKYCALISIILKCNGGKLSYLCFMVYSSLKVSRKNIYFPRRKISQKNSRDYVPGHIIKKDLY